MLTRIILLLGGYLLGSIPFGLIVGMLWKGVDIRKYGSGNIGTTNTLRALGRGPAAVVMVLDVSKGYFPVMAATRLFPGHSWIVLLAAMSAIIGHTLSVFLKLKGGKGVATSLGVIIGFDPIVAAIVFVVWVTFVALTKYVSLASIIACSSVPIIMLLFHKPIAYVLFGLVAATYVILKHRSNIKRLLAGNEARWGEKVEVKKETEESQ